MTPKIGYGAKKMTAILIYHTSSQQTRIKVEKSKPDLTLQVLCSPTIIIMKIWNKKIIFKNIPKGLVVNDEIYWRTTAGDVFLLCFGSTVLLPLV